jgi:glycosidase
VVWSDLAYEDETHLPNGAMRAPDRVVPDTAMFTFYRQLIEMRRDHLELFVRGDLQYTVLDDENGLMAYSRSLGDQHAVIAFNRSDSARAIALNMPTPGDYENVLGGEVVTSADSDAIHIELGAREAVVFVRR